MLEKELTHITIVFRNTNGYPNWIINQVFKQIKVKQRDPAPNSHVSSENEATQHRSQAIVENMMIKIIKEKRGNISKKKGGTGY